MPKIKVKSKRSAAKRFKVTKNGKVTYPKQGRRHLLTGKTSKRKRQLRSGDTLKECEAKRVRKLLPYS
ncbi:MAG TPA: 50S ribosomal protein L35 [Spirochaetota bacterium]|nr:50S ribosomal protein L35 [Spirochaetota bacterium]